MAAPEAVTVQLMRPKQDFGQTVSALVIARDLDGADLLAVEGLGTTSTTLKIIERVCRTPEGKPVSRQFVESLYAGDIRALDRALLPFGGFGPET